MGEVAVIGAGITGAYTAFLLANSGHKVIVLDAGSLPYRGTSCNPGGINPLHGPGVPGVMADFYMSCYRYHHLYHDKVRELSGIDYRFRVIERLFLAFTREEKASLLKMQDAYNSHQGFHARWCTPDQAISLDARISDKIIGGLLTHGNIVVDSEIYCEALKAAALKLGCQYLNENADDFITDGNRVTHIVAGGKEVACSAAILATGYWTGKLAAKLGVHVPVDPVKGELLVVEVNEGAFDFDITCGQTGLYHYKENLYWLGGTVEDPTFAPEITEQGKTEILDNIKVVLPGLHQYELVAHDTGYRPVSADELPVVGLLPGFENIYIGTGGGSKGILVSSGIGMALLDLVEGQNVDSHHFLTPERFDAA